MAKHTEKVFVVGAVILRDGKILATQRGYGNYSGWWEFPGGKIEIGEEPEDALKREINEELGAEIVIDRYFETTEYDYGDFYLSMRCYLCALAPGEEISLIEHMAAKWVGRDEVHSLKWLAADLPIIEHLRQEEIIS
jgi:8-oxo-dGTP diphosphatase